jgi:exportin-2 (importin alpha re-exporter)
MEPTAENLGHLVGFLSQTVSADPAARKAAEAQLSAAKVQQGYALLLLRVVVAAEAPPEVRLQGAIQLKNIINQHWQSSEIHDYHLSDMDKASVKSEIVAGSMSVPEKLQPFLSEALSTICNADFPIDRNWPQLLPQLMHSLESPDPSVIVAALKVVHAISQKYVTASHTDELWAEIKAVLELHDRLLHVYGNCLAAIQANAANRQILDVLFQTITLLANIFHDLNYQDIPEVFEDALDHWMQGFHSMLTLPDSVKALFPHQDGEQMTSMHNMQRSICEALLLYADKYIVVVEDSDRSAKPDERIVFQKHLQIFVEAVWGLLTNLGVQAEFDQLAAAAIQFLASVLKGTHHSFFQQAHLQSIVTNVVVPGLNIRESDEEDFEDNPLEYMQRDLEGGTTDTRRGVTCSLVNAMCKHFEAATSQLCMAEIESALSKSDWKSKDAAIYLFIALAVKAETRAGGVQVINPAVNVIEFFQKAVLPDLQVVTAANVSKKPILLADLLKFVLVFRNQLPKEAYAVLFPILNTMLTSTDCIVHTYAASCVEKFLTVKDGTAPRVSRADLQPMLQALLTNLFNCFSNEASKENPHIMKTVMRVVNVAQGDAVAVGPMLVGKLTAMLGEFCRAFAQGISPKNPAFHHYIFETLAAISKHICATGDPAAVTTMEGLILPPFQVRLHT